MGLALRPTSKFLGQLAVSRNKDQPWRPPHQGPDREISNGGYNMSPKFTGWQASIMEKRWALGESRQGRPLEIPGSPKAPTNQPLGHTAGLTVPYRNLAIQIITRVQVSDHRLGPSDASQVLRSFCAKP